MSNFKFIIGERIREFREFKGLSQGDLAKIVGVERAAVANWEAGKGVDAKHLFKLAEIFDLYFGLFDPRPVIPVLDADEAARRWGHLSIGQFMTRLHACGLKLGVRKVSNGSIVSDD